MLAAVLLDRLLGEPRRWHPLNGFAALAGWLESRLYGTADLGASQRRLRGALAVTLALLPLSLLIGWLVSVMPGGWLFSIAVLYCALGWQSLIEHARAVASALAERNLDLARERTGFIVGRDCDAMTEADVAGAALESVLENGNDAVFAALFWFAIGGAGGVVFYRLANTLDALWGYRNARYRNFGWAAARLDDVLNYLPARLTAFSYALCNRMWSALTVARQQAQAWPSVNAGWVMATGAAALQCEVGGKVTYQGVPHERPLLGQGRAAQANDINRALALVCRSVIVWLVVISVIALLLQWWLAHA